MYRIALRLSRDVALAVVAVGLAAASAEAQTNSLFGNNGAVGQSSGFNTLGGSTLGGSTGRAGTTGAAGAGATGAATGVTRQATQLGQLSSTVGQSGFVGRGDTAGAFVGSRNAGQPGSQTQTGFMQAGGLGRGTTGGFGRGTTGGFGRGTAGANQGRGQQFGGRTGSQIVIRPRQRIAFDYPAHTVAAMQTSLQTNFGRINTRSSGLNGVTLSMSSGAVVTLRGTVSSESAKRLAAAVARLEPGVRDVKNELQVRAN